MLMSKLNLKYLGWDSRLLGVKCGLIDATGFNPLTQPATLTNLVKALCKKKDFEFITIKIPYNFINSVNSMVKFGASLIDTELSFIYSGNLTSSKDRILSDKIKFKFCKEFKGDALVPLAKEMRFSRFFKDSNIPKYKAIHLWEESIRNHCEGLKDQSLIAYYDGKPCGIVTLEFQDINNIRLFLVGVLRRYRRKDVAKTMLTAIVNRYSMKHGIRVETQSDNVIAQRLYQSAGFKLEDLKYILHYWTPRVEI